MCSKQFADEAGLKLQEFYSNDKWRSNSKHDKKGKKRNIHEVDSQRKSNEINPYLKDTLWSLPHACSENHSGVLRLCIGLPVMIKKNLATECCVTNGAEARVVGWKCRPLDDTGKMQLETVLVELIAPPTPIQLKELPLDVISIYKIQTKVKCIMPNGKVLSISRDQVPPVPNFAMTDYSSQGRTRINNVIDLNNCKNHQSIYICLSRESTYEGTAIIQ